MKPQWNGRWVATTLALCLAASGLLEVPAEGIQLADGTVYFAQAPQLVGAKTFEKGVGSRIATYYFTVTVPEQAGVPLKRLILVQSEGTSLIQFVEQRTQASVNQQQVDIKVQEWRQDLSSRTTSFTFEPAIAPGQTVTLALRPTMNPSVPGTYMFGVTAVPEGEKAHGQFLGFARLQFYTSGSRGQG